MSRQQRMQERLQLELQPQILDIEDESHRHHVPEGLESHFKMIIVSEQFTSLNRIERHRLVNACLQSEFTQGLHALSLHLYAPQEWAYASQSSPTSPACRGGMRNDTFTKPKIDK